LTDNSQKLTINNVGNPLYNDLVASSEQVLLNSRYQVATKCSADCRSFRFGKSLPALSTGVVSLYSSIRLVAWIGGLGSLVCVVFLLYIVWAKSRATQTMYVYLWYCVLLLSLVLSIMLVVYLMRLLALGVVKTAFMTRADCITDTDWKTVFTNIGTATDLSSVKTWMTVFLVVFLLCFVGGVCVLYHVTKELAKCPKHRHRRPRSASALDY
jgi:hypothetical protein